MVQEYSPEEIYNYQEKELFPSGFFYDYKSNIEKIYFKYSNKLPIDSLFLDLGCHSGAFKIIYSKYFENIHMADFVDQRSVRSKHYPFYQLDLNATIDDAKIKDKFNFINCLEVIEHIENENSFLNNIKYLLKNNGYCLISTPNTNRINEKIKNLLFMKTQFPTNLEKGYNHVHYREYNIENLKMIFKNYDLKVIEHTYAQSNFGPIRIRKNIIPRKFRSNIICLIQKE